MEWLEWLSVVSLAAFKVIPALALAMTYNAHPFVIFLQLAIGSMLGVTFFTLFGVRIRQWRKARRIRKGIKKPINLKKARRTKKLWTKVGIIGIALLAPPMLSPPVGALIAVFFGEKMRRIFLFMFLSCILWAAIFALLGHQILQLLYQ